MTVPFKIAFVIGALAAGSFIIGHMFAQFGSPYPRVTNWADVCAGICGIIFMIALVAFFPTLIYAVIES